MITRMPLDPPPLVYVVTLTWNRRDDTLRCLDSLSKLSYPNARILVVDNASEDDTVIAVRRAFPNIEVIINKHNLGFSGGFNVGLRHVMSLKANYALMINNDTVAAPNLLDELMAYAGYADVGLLAPKIFWMDEPNRIWSVGGRRSWWNYEMIESGNNELDSDRWQQPLERDYLVGCAWLVKTSLLNKVGMFDEATYSPAYYEDSDWCVRARASDLRLLLIPSAQVWHKGAQSSGGYSSPSQVYLMARNSVRFFKKHVRGWRWLVVVPFRLGSAIKATIRLSRTGSRAGVRAYWRGLRDGVFGSAR
jgi:GT2 family glycosyltransferase